MQDLVHRLSEGMHPVEVGVRPEPTVSGFKESLDRGYVLIKFTDTRGGTELGVPVDWNRSDISKADFEHEHGEVRVVGSLTLDYVPVRCVAEISLPSLRGQGRLELLDAN